MFDHHQPGELVLSRMKHVTVEWEIRVFRFQEKVRVMEKDFVLQVLRQSNTLNIASWKVLKVGIGQTQVLVTV